MHQFIRILLLFLFAISLESQAQTIKTLTGRVLDSSTEKPLEAVTISIYSVKDSALLSYTVSKNSGDYAFYNIPKVPCFLKFSCIGYLPLKKNINLEELKNGNIFQDMTYLKTSSITLNEIEVKSTREAVVIKLDTIEFNIEHFKTRQNATVEELLRKLPGIQVNMDGSIYIEGKQIKKLFVNGKPFFNADPKIATRNLYADMIDKVQLLSKPISDSTENSLGGTKAINLELKKEYRKSLFGKAHAQLGSSERYDIGGMVNFFKDTLQISVIGFSNNSNKSSFTFGDINSLGGFDRSGIKYVSVGSENQVTGVNGITFGGGGKGIQRIHSGGFNVNYDVKKILKFNAQYFTSITNDNILNNSSEQQFLESNSLYYSKSNEGEVKEFSNLFTSDLWWKPLKTITIKFNCNFSSSNSNSNKLLSNLTTMTAGQDSAISLAMNQLKNQSSTYRYNQTVEVKKNYAHGKNLTISSDFQFDPTSQNSYGYLIEYIKNYEYVLDTAIRKRNENSNIISANLTSSYYYPIRKTPSSFNFTLYQEFIKRRIEGELISASPEKVKDNYNLGNFLNRKEWLFQTRFGFTTKIKKKLILKTRVIADYRQFNNTLFGLDTAKYTNGNTNFIGKISLEYQKYTFEYNSNLSSPDLRNLNQLPDNLNARYLFVGNPYLKPTKQHQFHLSTNNLNPKTEFSYSFYADISFGENSVIMKRFVDEFGFETSTPVNKNERPSLSLGMNLGKNLRKFKDITLSSRGGVSFSRNLRIIYLNDKISFSDRNSILITKNLSIDWNNKIQFEPEYSYTYNFSNDIGLINNIPSNHTHSFNSFLALNIFKNLNLETSLNYKFSSIDKTFSNQSNTLVNSSISLNCLRKKQGELKISVFDLLNTNNRVGRRIEENWIVDSQTKVLTRFISLDFIYKFKSAANQ